MFSSGLILHGHGSLWATSQSRHLSHVILFTVNYWLFANSNVSIRFNGKDNYVVRALSILEFCKMLIHQNNSVQNCLVLEILIHSITSTNMIKNMFSQLSEAFLSLYTYFRHHACKNEHHLTDKQNHSPQMKDRFYFSCSVKMSPKYSHENKIPTVRHTVWDKVIWFPLRSLRAGVLW